MVINSWISQNKEFILATRRHLHAYPELSMQEFATTQYLVDIVKNCGLIPHVFPWGTGLYCDIFPDKDEISLAEAGKNKTICAIRADIDALPIQEDTGLTFSSSKPGISHSCGHDIHTAIGVGVLQFLSQPEIKNRLIRPVRIIFQPAEEIMPGGALACVNAGALRGVQEILALHCDPKIPVGTIGLKTGNITSAADKITINVRGKGGHTSRPHLSSDVIGALAHIANLLPLVLTRTIDPQSSTVMVWGKLQAGTAPNAIPEKGVLAGTVRTRSYEVWQRLEDLCVPVITHALEAFFIEYDIDYQQGVPPVVNDPHIVETLSMLMERIAHIKEVPTDQSGGGEDFSWYLQDIPGVMFRLGVGEPGISPDQRIDLHRPGFIAHEDALEVGIEVFLSYILHTCFG